MRRRSRSRPAPFANIPSPPIAWTRCERSRVTIMNFVIGHPRGGTHFVHHLLNTNGRVVAIHEHLHSLTGFDVLGLARAYYERTADAAAVREMVRMYRLRPQVPIDCNFLLAWILPAVLEEHRDAKILHLVR